MPADRSAPQSIGRSIEGRPRSIRLIAIASCWMWLCVLAVGVLPATAEEPKLTEAQSRRLLIDGEVLDAETNEPVETFRVIPGVRYNAARGKRGNVAVWQPHMIREMSDGVFQWPRTRGYDEMRFRVEAEGYRAATTTWLGKGGPHLRMKVHLRPDAGIQGVVVAPDGSLASGATLAIGLPNREVRLDGFDVVGSDRDLPARLSDRWRRPLSVKTNQQGEFLLPYESDPSAVVCVVHESGYLEETFVDWASLLDQTSDTVIVQLEPWAQIKGRVWWKDRPGQKEQINLTMHRNEPYPGLVAASSMTVSDDEGNFRFEHVPPGSVHLSRTVRADKSDSAVAPFLYPNSYLLMKPGEIKEVAFGGEGIDVTGKLLGLESYNGVTISIRPPAPDVWNMQRFGAQGVAAKLQKGYLAFRKSDDAAFYFRDSIPVDADGAFRIKDVMTGQYNLWLQGANGASKFSVDIDRTEPLDIGTIQAKPAPVPIVPLPAAARAPGRGP